jgi:hypothetical protein
MVATLAMRVLRKLRPLIVVLVVFVVLWLVDGRGSAVHEVTGNVVEWRAGQSISVVNDQTDPGGVRIDVRATDYDGDRGAIRTGARVTVWYRHVGERSPVALTVRVLDPQTPAR